MEPTNNTGNSHKRVQRALGLNKFEEDIVFWHKIPLEINGVRSLQWHPFLLPTETTERIADKSRSRLEELTRLSPGQLELKRFKDIQVLATYGPMQVA